MFGKIKRAAKAALEKATLYTAKETPGWYMQAPYGIIRQRYYACCNYTTDKVNIFQVKAVLTKAEAESWLKTPAGSGGFISVYYISDAESHPPIEVIKVLEYEAPPPADLPGSRRPIKGVHN